MFKKLATRVTWGKIFSAAALVAFVFIFESIGGNFVYDVFTKYLEQIGFPYPKVIAFSAKYMVPIAALSGAFFSAWQYLDSSRPGIHSFRYRDGFWVQWLINVTTDENGAIVPGSTTKDCFCRKFWRHWRKFAIQAPGSAKARAYCVQCRTKYHTSEYHNRRKDELALAAQAHVRDIGFSIWPAITAIGITVSIVLVMYKMAPPKNLVNRQITWDDLESPVPLPPKPEKISFTKDDFSFRLIATPRSDGTHRLATEFDNRSQKTISIFDLMITVSSCSFRKVSHFINNGWEEQPDNSSIALFSKNTFYVHPGGLGLPDVVMTCEKFPEHPAKIVFQTNDTRPLIYKTKIILGKSP